MNTAVLKNSEAEIKVDVYRVLGASHELYRYKGQLINDCGEYTRWQKCVLHVPAQEGEHVFSRLAVYVYQPRSTSDGGVQHYGDFYISEEEASRHFKFEGWKSVQRFTLFNEKPTAPEEFIVQLLRNERGGLYVHINNHPEDVGSNAVGKCFFPDRSWSEATEGMARVKVSYEKDTYGFITGEMLPDITLSEVLDYVWDRENFSAQLSLLVNKETGKELFGLSYSPGYLRLFERGMHGLECSELKRIADIMAEYADYDFSNYSVLELLAMDRYGLSKEEVSELMNFTESEFYEWSGVRIPTRSVTRFCLHWERGSGWFVPDGILGDAVELGCVKTVALTDFSGIQIYTIDPSGIAAALELSLDEFRQLVEEFNTANKNADDAIKVKIRKGLIKPRS